LFRETCEDLLGLGGLSLEVGRGASLGEVLGENGLHEGSVDDLSTAGLGKSHPQNKDKLEGVVKGEPVDGVDSALKDSQERIDHPVRQPLSIIGTPSRKQCMKGIVGRKDKADGIDEELGGNVEEDQEEIHGTKAKDDIDLLDTGLLLEFIERAIFTELLIELGDMVLGAILDRHFGSGWKEDMRC